MSTTPQVEPPRLSSIPSPLEPPITEALAWRTATLKSSCTTQGGQLSFQSFISNESRTFDQESLWMSNDGGQTWEQLLTHYFSTLPQAQWVTVWHCPRWFRNHPLPVPLRHCGRML